MSLDKSVRSINAWAGCIFGFLVGGLLVGAAFLVFPGIGPAPAGSSHDGSITDDAPRRSPMRSDTDTPEGSQDFDPATFNAGVSDLRSARRPARVNETIRIILFGQCADVLTVSVHHA